jgi:phage-related protein
MAVPLHHRYTSIRVFLYSHLLYNNGALLPSNMAVTCYCTWDTVKSCEVPYTGTDVFFNDFNALLDHFA